MDEDRKIRFLIAPLFFIASILWGLLRDPQTGINNILPGFEIQIDKISNIIAILAGGGIAIFSLGFLIGTTTYVILRLCFIIKAKCCGGSKCHEIALSNRSLNKIWNILGLKGDLNNDLQLFIGVSYDHGIMQRNNEGVHRWVVRRWNAFSVAVTSTTGLFLSLLVGRLLGIHFVTSWWLPTFIFMCIFITSACFAWNDVMGMISFQANYVQLNEKDKG